MTEYILAPWLGMSGDAIVAGYAGSGGVSEITAAGACCEFSCAWTAFETHSTEQSRSTNQPKCFMVRYDTANVSVGGWSTLKAVRRFWVAHPLGSGLSKGAGLDSTSISPCADRQSLHPNSLDDHVPEVILWIRG